MWMPEIACVVIHVAACVGMPVEKTIYLSTDHVRAQESCRGIREVVKKIMQLANTWLAIFYFIAEVTNLSVF